MGNFLSSNKQSKGDFNFIHDKICRNTLQNVYQTITTLNYWPWLCNYKSNNKLFSSFIYELSQHKNIKIIQNKLDYQTNNICSQLSWQYIMYNMHYIAHLGWNKWVENYKECYQKTHTHHSFQRQMPQIKIGMMGNYACCLPVGLPKQCL